MLHVSNLFDLFCKIAVKRHNMLSRPKFDVKMRFRHGVEFIADIMRINIRDKFVN